MRAWMNRIWAYFDSVDPRAAIAGSVSFVVLSNQPFYPLYLYFVLGGRAWPSMLTWLSSPLFAAVPLAGRDHPPNACRLLLVAGIGNTALATVALGVASWVELFYLPCALLAVILFAGRARWTAIGTSLVAMVACACLVRLTFPEGLAAVTSEEFTSLARINMFSVAGLTGVIAFMSRRLVSSS